MSSEPIGVNAFRLIFISKQKRPVHREYLVNMAFIMEYGNDSITLNNGQTFCQRISIANL